MALSASFLSSILLLLIFSSTLVLARESQFFSKLSRSQNTNHNTNITLNIGTTINGNTAAHNNSITTIITVNGKQVKIPKEQSLLGKERNETVKTEELPQLSNSYGLYSHEEVNESPSSTTMTPTGFPDVQNSPTNIETSLYASVPEEIKAEGDNGESSAYGEFNDNNKYETKQYDVRDTKSMGDDFNRNVHEVKPDVMTDTKGLGNNYGSSSSSNHYEAEQYGTSDARKGNSYASKNFAGMKQQRISDTRFMANGRYYYDVNNENSNRNEYLSASGSDDTSKGNSYASKSFAEMKQQGLSDTRFMANGRYFHDVNNENNNRHDYLPASGSNDDVGSSKGVVLRNEFQYQTYGGKTENPNEYNPSGGRGEVGSSNGVDSRNKYYYQSNTGDAQIPNEYDLVSGSRNELESSKGTDSKNNYYYQTFKDNTENTNAYLPASGRDEELDQFSRGMDLRNKYEYQTYNGNTENPNEFDDSEYEEQINKENQGGYFP